MVKHMHRRADANIVPFDIIFKQELNVLKSKLKKAKFLLCLVILVAIFMVPVSAYQTSYSYTFSGTGPCWKFPNGYYSKDDNEQSAYVSINQNQSSNYSGERVYLWARPEESTVDFTSSNRYFTDYGSYSLPYIRPVCRGMKFGVFGWHNNYSSPRTFTVGGHWCP